MPKRRILYLPVETKARELLGKTFLAARAAERGWITVLGHQNEVFRAEEVGPGGACVENSIPDYKAPRLKAFRSRGHRIVSLCEENIVYTDGWDYCNRKIGPAAVEQADLVCTAGNWNAAHLREFRPSSGPKVRLTGNPRFDTLMPEYREVYAEPAQRIREEFGRILLVNTNFGISNPFKRGEDRIARIASRGKVADANHAAFMARWRSYKADHMERLKALLAEVAASGAFDRVVIRPHPVENHEVWREWAEPLGMEVRYDGTASVWILAADAVLHTGCTTGIEGILLDRPVASFVFDAGSEFLNCTDAVSVQVSSAGELLARVAEWRAVARADVRAYLAPQRALIQSYIENVERPLAADRILDALDELDLPEHSLAAASAPWGVQWKARELMAEAREALRRVRYGRRRDAQKFPSLALRDMTEPIGRWVATGALGQMPSFTRVARRVWLVA